MGSKRASKAEVTMSKGTAITDEVKRIPDKMRVRSLRGLGENGVSRDQIRPCESLQRPPFLILVGRISSKEVALSY